MKQGSNGKGRLRGRNQASKGRGPNRNHNQTYDSNGPGVRVRGNAHQVVEKYQAMARDAAAQGDRVLCENYLQHAEHYFRIILAQNAHNPGKAQRLDQSQALMDGPESFGDDLEEAAPSEPTAEATASVGGQQEAPENAAESGVATSSDEEPKPRRRRSRSVRAREAAEAERQAVQEQSTAEAQAPGSTAEAAEDGQKDSGDAPVVSIAEEAPKRTTRRRRTAKAAGSSGDEAEKEVANA